MALLGGPHVLAVHFVVPPGVAEISGDHIRARMNVADNALARRNRARELMTNGMAGFVARNGGIGSCSLSLIAVNRVCAGMLRRSVVGIDDMAGAASAGTVVAGLIVGAGERKQRVEQARFLKAKKNRVGGKFCPEA